MFRAILSAVLSLLGAGLAGGGAWLGGSIWVWVLRR